MKPGLNRYTRLSQRFWLARCAACIAAMACTAAIADEPLRPNVLFLLSDDQRTDTISALGNSSIRTPNLDRLVRGGSVMRRAYCMGAQQGAVCVPSRAMLLTGRSLFRVQEDLAGQATWPEAFSEAGYTTFMTGKWHNGPDSLLRVFPSGNAIFLGGMGDPFNLPLQDISADHKLINPRTTRGEHSVKVFADAASEFIRKYARKGPFLCYVAFNAPHDPRAAPPEYHARFKEQKPPLPPNFLPQHPFDNGDMTGRDESLAPWPRTESVVRQHLADYYASIEHLDAQVGRILDALKSSGEYENTIIVFSSDHGLAIGSHGLFGKQNLYEHSMRSPVILAGPGIPKGKRFSEFCCLFDLFPTIGELAKLKPPDGSEGHSLVPVFANHPDAGRTSIFTAFAKVQRAIRDDRWKLIVYPQINKKQLFDLQADPFELTDLSSDSSHQKDLDRMLALLRSSQRQYGDDLPLETEHPRPAEIDLSKRKTL